MSALLVVDADADSRAQLERLGREALVDVVACAKPDEAIARATERSFDGALIDLSLGDRDAAFGLARSGQVLLRAVTGMALGFAYFMVDNFSLAMGNAGTYPPLVAAWAPFLLFLLIGETVLIRTEE